MRDKTSDKVQTLMLVAAAIVFVVADVLVWHEILAYDALAFAAPVRAEAPMPAKAAQVTAPATQPGVGVPVRLKIPGINVNAAIVSVGMAADGSMGVPTKPRDTAWYDLGPRPGEIGSAVISGHVNWLYGATGAFERLKNLKPGKVITVQDDRGAVTSFIVRTSRNYDVTADATDVFSSTDGKAHLNLITCGGTWDKRAKQYTKRLVVFADKVE
jgi:LPXTG-site transpeptidase (sortase) family protein